MLRFLVSALFVATLLGPTAAFSQVPQTAPSVSLSAGWFNFDLSGTGDTLAVAVQGTLPISPLVLVEGGLLFARPRQQFGEITTLVVPDIQAQLQWPLGRVAPYIGLGGGAVLDFASDDAGGLDSDLAISGAAGARAALTDRLGVRAELRVYGFGTRFTGSGTALTAGLAWRL